MKKLKIIISKNCISSTPTPESIFVRELLFGKGLIDIISYDELKSLVIHHFPELNLEE